MQNRTGMHKVSYWYRLRNEKTVFTVTQAEKCAKSRRVMGRTAHIFV
jgi:hypothetical protein